MFLPSIVEDCTLLDVEYKEKQSLFKSLAPFVTAWYQKDMSLSALEKTFGGSAGHT